MEGQALGVGAGPLDVLGPRDGDDELLGARVDPERVAEGVDGQPQHRREVGARRLGSRHRCARMVVHRDPEAEPGSYVTIGRSSTSGHAVG